MQLGVNLEFIKELCGINTAGRIGSTAPGAGSPQILLPAPACDNGVTGQGWSFSWGRTCDIWYF